MSQVVPQPSVVNEISSREIDRWKAAIPALFFFADADVARLIIAVNEKLNGPNHHAQANQ